MADNRILVSSLLIAILSILFFHAGQSLGRDDDIKTKLMAEIHGYHFHTYFFQTNLEITQEALRFRDSIQDQIDSGFLANCRLNRVNMGPVGPHPIGSYETCCNKTSISQALTWFMENHGNLSVLLHPLTRFEVQDHTHRAMFLGKELPLDVSVLSEDLVDNVDLCLPISTDDHVNAVY